jgi:hypothetical protein
MPTMPHQSTHVDNEKHGKIKSGRAHIKQSTGERNKDTHIFHGLLPGDLIPYMMAQFKTVHDANGMVTTK